MTWTPFPTPGRGFLKRMGGIFDPVTGKADEKKLEAVRDPILHASLCCRKRARVRAGEASP